MTDTRATSDAVGNTESPTGVWAMSWRRRRSWWRRCTPLTKRMEAIDWAIQRIGADLSGLHLIGYAGPMPEQAPFEWVTEGKCIPWTSPGLRGVRLSYQHLTPEQMAFCLEHDAELEAWATAMRQVYERERARYDKERRAEYARRDAADAERHARFIAEVKRLRQ